MTTMGILILLKRWANIHDGHHNANVTIGKEALDPIGRGLKDGMHCRWHQYVGWEDRKIGDSSFLGG